MSGCSYIGRIGGAMLTETYTPACARVGSAAMAPMASRAPAARTSQPCRKEELLVMVRVCMTTSWVLSCALDNARTCLGATAHRTQVGRGSAPRSAQGLALLRRQRRRHIVIALCGRHLPRGSHVDSARVSPGRPSIA